MNSLHVGNAQKPLVTFIFRRFLLSRHNRAVSRYSTESAETPYKKKNEEELAEIENKRNKSGLHDHFRDLMVDQKPPPVVFDFQLTTQYKRKMYAKFGRASGIEPSIMWPTKQELKDGIELENEFCPTLEEMVERRRQMRMEEANAIRRKEESVDYNMSKLGKWLEELKQRRDKKLATIQAQKDKKEQLIEEVRQYFGYRLSPKDPKFVEVLEKKEKEENKIAKDAKRQEKFAREMAKLASMAQAGSKGDLTAAKEPKKPPETNQ